MPYRWLVTQCGWPWSYVSNHWLISDKPHHSW